VADAIHSKMVRRHPHVFGDTEVRDNRELLRNWEAIKAEEKRAAGKAEEGADASLLDGVSARAPALMESHQLTTKAARVGFDWERVEDIFDKLHEEIDELREAIREQAEAGADPERVREEVGDLLFAVTNIARHLGVEPEAALKLTNRKFRRRFRHIERGLKARGQEPGAATLEEMEELWQEAKSLES
jgi:MazG family protein